VPSAYPARRLWPLGVRLTEHCADLVARQDHWQPFRPSRVHQAPQPRDLQLQHRAHEQRALSAWVCVEATFPHLRLVALVVEEDVPPGPRDIRFFSATTVVVGTDYAADPIEETRLGRGRRLGLANDEAAPHPSKGMVPTPAALSASGPAERG